MERAIRTRGQRQEETKDKAKEHPQRFKLLSNLMRVYEAVKGGE